MTPTEAAAVVQERFGVEPSLEGSLLTVALPRERWEEFARFAKADLWCGYFTWI